MAFSTPALATPSVRANAASVTSASFTVTSGDNIFAFVSQHPNSASATPTAPTISDSQGRTWTKVDERLTGGGGTGATTGHGMTVWRTTSNGAAMTVTATRGSNVTHIRLSLVTFSGAASSFLSAQDGNDSGTPSVVLGSAPAASSINLAFFQDSSTTTTTPPTGYTELVDSFVSTTSLASQVCYHAGPSPPQTTTWSESTRAGAIVIEVKEASQALTPSLFTNTQTFYAPTVTPGAVTLTPALFTATQTFHSPTLTPGAVTLSPSPLANGQTFYAATVARGTATLSPSLFTNAQAFYSATASPGAVSLAPPLLANSPSFHGPTVAAGTVALAPSLFTSAQTFYSADLEQGDAPPAPETSPERILTLYGHGRIVTVPRLSIRSLRPAPIGRRLPVPQLVRTVVCDATPPRVLAVPRDNPRRVIA